MRFKDEVSCALYYKKLGNKAYESKKFEQATNHYVTGLESYPFLMILRNAKASLKQYKNVELEKLLDNLESLKVAFLEKKSREILPKFFANEYFDIKAEFFKYPYIKYPEVIHTFQVEIGEYLLASQNEKLQDFFIYLGKYNLQDKSLLPYVNKILERLPEHDYIESAIFDLNGLVKYFGDLIEDRLPLFSNQLIGILQTSSKFNQRRYSIFGLEALGERNFKFIERSLPELYNIIKNPEAISENLVGDGIKVSTPLFSINMEFSFGPDPHIWVLDAAISAVGSLALKYPTQLEYFIPIILDQLLNGNQYTQKKSLQAIVNFKSAGIDIEKYFPKKNISHIVKLLQTPSHEYEKNDHTTT